MSKSCRFLLKNKRLLKDTSDKSYIFNIYSLHGFTGSGEDFSILNKSIEAQLESLSVFINWYVLAFQDMGILSISIAYRRSLRFPRSIH